MVNFLSKFQLRRTGYGPPRGCLKQYYVKLMVSWVRSILLCPVGTTEGRRGGGCGLLYHSLDTSVNKTRKIIVSLARMSSVWGFIHTCYWSLRAAILLLLLLLNPLLFLLLLLNFLFPLFCSSWISSFSSSSFSSYCSCSSSSLVLFLFLSPVHIEIFKMFSFIYLLLQYFINPFLGWS